MEEFESKILAEVAKGNLSAVREIVGRYQKPLLNFVSKFVSDKTTTEDISQEVFLRVFKAAKNYKPKAKFKTWLFKIAVNYCLNEIRADKNSPQCIDLFELNEAGFLAVAPSTYSPEKELENRELGDILRKAIADLQAKLEKEVINHILQEKEILTLDQQRQFHEIIKKEFEKGGLGIHGERP